MYDTYFVKLNIQSGEYQKDCIKLIFAQSEDKAMQSALSSECHGSLEDGTAELTETGISDLGNEFHYSVAECKKVAPEDVIVLRSYFFNNPHLELKKAS